MTKNGSLICTLLSQPAVFESYKPGSKAEKNISVPSQCTGLLINFFQSLANSGCKSTQANCAIMMTEGAAGEISQTNMDNNNNTVKA